ncbi:MAG: methyltransferase [Nitrospinota bacterium]|nr:methyltransferase [Nitrospinota bacterium]
MNPSTIKATLDQSEYGYRYNQDSFLLASFFRQDRPGLMADFCAGAGVVSILIGSHRPSQPILALELNRSMATMAAKNAAAYGLKNYRIIEADVMTAPRLFKGRPFSAIVANPPYRKRGHGRLNHDLEKAMARHEVAMTLSGLVVAASQLLAPGGTLTLVMLVSRREEYLSLLSGAGFCESRVRLIRYRSFSPAKVFLSEAVYGEKALLTEEPPLIVEEENGWSPEYKSIVEKYGG